MANYITRIYDPSGELVADISSMSTKRSIDKQRNRADVISLEYSLDDIKKFSRSISSTAWDIFGVDRSEVRIFRNDTVISAGQIVIAEPGVSGDQRTFKIKAVGWLDLFAKRYTEQLRKFELTDAGQIAATLIEEAQAIDNGDFGIIEGNIQPSVDRERTYEYKNIRDAIIQLSEVINGFDFEFTWDKMFNVYYPYIGSQRPDIIFSYPGNIEDVSFQRDGMEIANKVTARGAGFGGDNITATAEDITSQEKYGLREIIVDYNDVILYDTLLEHAEAEILQNKEFVDIPDITVRGDIEPKFGQYNIGDYVKLNISRDNEIFSPINGMFRIDAMNIDVDVNNVEKIRMQLMK